ncbi:MAG: RNA methyltransferase [Pyrinomonadaceae bacterium]|nr:RNA methyltransferase [Pyrinomonadaceae bacterium]MCX7639568.1 RNA methyltransferase [Pyrinomonadaceae bacterium]MDW8303961.1 RNA methyltransferase [Acidobacteriota bacterium]
MKPFKWFLEGRDLSFKEKERLWDYLSSYLTTRRRSLFEKVVKERTLFVTVAVEDVYQERNASAVVRSAECFGIQSVHIIENKHEYKIAKGIAKGAEKWLDVYLYDKPGNDNTATCLERLKELGYCLVAASPHEEDCYIGDLELNQPVAFIMGGEKEGLSQTALRMAEKFVKIPIYGFTESYNISVATAIILYETTKRLRSGEDDSWRLNREKQLDLMITWALKSISNPTLVLERYFQELDSF